MRPAALALLALVLLACGVDGPVPLRWGEVNCTHCHMALADRRFGAEVITTHGRDLPFDDAGCAAEAIASDETPATEVGSVWVIDYTRPDSFIAADSAVFVRSHSFRTPMGSGIVATPSVSAAASLAAASGGVMMRWSDVLAAARAGELRPN